MHMKEMTKFACPKCGESYDAFPPLMKLIERYQDILIEILYQAPLNVKHAELLIESIGEIQISNSSIF